MVWWLERAGKREGRREREGEKEENKLLQFVLYKSEVVFLSGRLTLFLHRAKQIT